MKKVLLVSVIGTLVLAGCNQKAPEPAEVQTTPNRPMCQIKENMPGGWNISKVTPEVQSALDTVMSQMNTAAKVKEINEVRTQVVSGLNYAIEFTLDNDEVWNTVVYRDLQGNYKMIQVAKQGHLCP
ncbi:cystatin domain-containing protein [Vibrio sp. NTOU-M3]|uniref:cystatin domain-containing protein n=1 Tax=Vibrio sp. NTOU-M3 TaxID=3234954 RepID=UPI00349F227C